MENIKSIEPTCKTIKIKEAEWGTLMNPLIKNFDLSQNNNGRIPKLKTVNAFVLLMKDALYHTKSNCEEPSLQEVQEEMYLEAVFAIHKVLGTNTPINKEDNLKEIFKGRERVWKDFNREFSYSIEPTCDMRFELGCTIILFFVFVFPFFSFFLYLLWLWIERAVFGDNLFINNSFFEINIVHGIIIGTYWLSIIYKFHKKGWLIIPYDTIENLCDSVVANHLPIYGKYLTEEEIVKMSKILLEEYSTNISSVNEIGLGSKIEIIPMTPM